MRKLKVEGPNSPEAVEAAYRSSEERHTRERLLAIRLAQEGGYTLEQTGDILGRGRVTVSRWLRSYRRGGISVGLDKR